MKSKPTTCPFSSTLSPLIPTTPRAARSAVAECSLPKATSAKAQAQRQDKAHSLPWIPTFVGTSGHRAAHCREAVRSHPAHPDLSIFPALSPLIPTKVGTQGWPPGSRGIRAPCPKPQAQRQDKAHSLPWIPTFVGTSGDGEAHCREAVCPRPLQIPPRLSSPSRTQPSRRSSRRTSVPRAASPAVAEFVLLARRHKPKGGTRFKARPGYRRSSV